MIISSTIRRYASLTLSLAALSIAVSGCASTRPVAYRELASSAQLRPNTHDDSARVPYRYAEKVDWSQYQQVILPSVSIYSGADAQFEKTSAEDLTELATYMHEEFSERLSRRFQVVKAPTAKALRIQLTLTGARASTQVVSTFTHFDLAGLPYNAVQSARGKEGLLMGSASYAVEIYDAETNRLLHAFVAKQFPNAMNVKSTFGSLRAAKTAINKGADELIAQLE